MKREFISPKGDWHRFENDGEKLSYLQEVGLTPKSFAVPKQIYYRGVFVDNPVECEAVGYIDYSIVVIEIEGNLHCIAVDHLIEMQLTKQEEELYGFRIVPESKPNREHKGRSIIAMPTEYVVVDLETTGYYPAWDKIIEIGAIRIKDGEPIESYQHFVNPGEQLEDFMVELTGITDEMLKNEPKIDAVLPSFRDFLGDSIIVGQNTGFDVNFLYDAYIDVFGEPLTQDYINIMRFSRKLFPEMEHHRLSDISTACGVTGASFHRALNDCEYTYKSYEIMRGIIEARPDGFDGFARTFKKKSSKKKKHHNAIKLSELTTDKTDFDETHPLYGKICVFTGKLEKYTRTEAAHIVLAFGGKCEDRVTKKTNFLVMGNYDYIQSVKGGKSSKRKKAESYIAEGQDLTILPEDAFYDMIDE